MISKEQLDKLMKLDSKKADNYLSNLASNLEKMIVKSKRNDSIYEKLEILESFVYKATKETVRIFKYILHTSFPTSKSRTKFGIFEGKTRSDVILKGLDLLSEIRYILPNKVLPLLEEVIGNETNPTREKALEILKKFTKYDYQVLFKSKIGYRAQRTALDYILKWSFKKRLANIDFVLVIVKELLNSSVEGSSWTNESTLAMNFSQIDPTDFLKKMRRDTMDYIYDLYAFTTNPKVKLQLASALEEALRGPSNIAYSDSVMEMLKEDAGYLASIYRRMIFDESQKLIKENIAVAEEAEERLYYFAKPEKGRPSELIELHEDILKDPFYNQVCPMIGGQASYRGEEGYEESKQRRQDDQKNIITQISDENFSEWMLTLDILARQKEVIEEWKLADFKRFLELLSWEKPEIADKFLTAAFKTKEALAKFSECFLIGFQLAKKFDLWDKYSELIIKTKSPYLIGGICNSLLGYTSDQPPRKLRINELAILEGIVSKKGRFIFLKSVKKDNDMWYLHDRLFNALAFSFNPQKRKIENLIMKEIEDSVEYAPLHYKGLQFATTVIKWIDLSLASNTFKKYLLKKVIEAPALDWDLQEFLIKLCGKDFNSIMDVFKKRIVRAVSLQKKDKSRGMKRLMKKEFEAIPYHLNPDLQKLLTENEEKFSGAVKKWVQKMTLGWSLYNWEVSRFLEALKVDERKIFQSIVGKGTEKDLLQIAYAIERSRGTDFELCMQIIGRTDNKKTKNKIGSIMYSTGVVSGEYGIAEAYEKKAEALKAYTVSDNQRIKKFALEMIDSLDKSATEERARVAEAIQLRKIQFEG